MSISPLMDIGASALNAQQLALDVTSGNITNASTPGYSKETALLSSSAPTTAYGLSVGSGVRVTTVQRSYDSFLQGQIVSENSTSGQATTTNSTLQLVQSNFTDLTSSGLGTSLQGFFSAWQDLAANPQGSAERQEVLATGQSLADQFNQMSSSLTGVQDSLNQSLTGITSNVNNQLSQVATLNGQILAVTAGGGQANTLSDQRDLLIQQLAQNVGITSAQQSDGSISVSLSSGQALVTGVSAASLSLQANAANSGYYDVMLTPPGGGAAVTATSFIGGPGNGQGNMGATLQLRDTTVKGYLSSLDELASTVVAQVNTAQAAGYGLTGSTGVNFFNAPATVTAANISVSITSASDLAAADVDPTTGGTGNNINATAVANLYNKTNPMPIAGGAMTMANAYSALVGKVGTDVQTAGQNQSQADSMTSQLSNLRDSVSGVSLNEELSNLSQQQQAFQAAAKLITTGTQMLDTLMAMIT